MTETDLPLNVPESSGPELARIQDGLFRAEIYYEQCKADKHPQWKLDALEAGLGILRQRVAHLEAAEMQRRATL